MHCLPIRDVGISGPGAGGMSAFRLKWIIRGLVLIILSSGIGIVDLILREGL